MGMLRHWTIASCFVAFALPDCSPTNDFQDPGIADTGDDVDSIRSLVTRGDQLFGKQMEWDEGLEPDDDDDDSDENDESGEENPKP